LKILLRVSVSPWLTSVSVISYTARMTRFFVALLLFVPAVAAAQDQPPSPPKQEIVTIRTATFEVTGSTSASFFEFTQRCESKQGIAASSVTLTLPLDLEADPNDSLERVTKLLRDATAHGTEVSVESAGERPKVMFFYWTALPQFKGVIEHLAVKYTLFLPDGTPTRATVNMRMRQAGRVQNKEEASKPGEKKKSDCSPSQQ